jgi:hypothetical protein
VWVSARSRGNPQRNRSTPARARMRVSRVTPPPTCSSPHAGRSGVEVAHLLEHEGRTDTEGREPAGAVRRASACQELTSAASGHSGRGSGSASANGGRRVLAGGPIRGDQQAHRAVALMAEQPPASWTSPMLEATSSSSPPPTSPDCSVRDRAVVSPAAATLLLQTIWRCRPVRGEGSGRSSCVSVGGTCSRAAGPRAAAHNHRGGASHGEG